MKKPTIICVVGPTASGKSELAVKLAKKYNGEIISVDSRQIYKGFDIGAGKVPGKWNNKVFLHKNIPHYLIDEASPRIQYSVSRFKNNASKKIQQIIKKDKLPILCGGTMHWMDALVFDQTLPNVKPNPKLRKQLEKLSTLQLFSKLKKLDPTRSKEIDPHNPRRLIRALEIVMSTGKVVPRIKSQPKYKTIWIGINPGLEVLETKIKKRLTQRLKQGMLNEVTNLHEQGLSWKKLESFGLEYKYCALFLQSKISRQELEEQLFTAIRQYAKRQLTWWKRNKLISWIPDGSQNIPLINF